MKIKHAGSSVKEADNNGELLEYWMRYSGQEIPHYCPEKVCVRKAEVAAKVLKCNSSDCTCYIIPMCKKHFALKDKIIDINDKVMLVPADTN